MYLQKFRVTAFPQRNLVADLIPCGRHVLTVHQTLSLFLRQSSGLQGHFIQFFVQTFHMENFLLPIFSTQHIGPVGSLDEFHTFDLSQRL